MSRDSDLEHDGLPRLGAVALIALLLATAGAAVVVNRLLVHDRSNADHQRADATATRVQAAVKRAVSATQSLHYVVGVRPNPAEFGAVAHATIGVADDSAQAALIAGVNPAKRRAFAADNPGVDLSAVALRPAPSGRGLLFPALAVSGRGPLPARPGADAGADPALLRALRTNNTLFGLVVVPRTGAGAAGVWLAQASETPPGHDSDAGFVATFFPVSALLGDDAGHATLRVGSAAVEAGRHLHKPLTRALTAGGQRWTVLVARRSLSLGARIAPAVVVLFGIIIVVLVWLSLGGVVRRHRDAVSMERRRGERRVLAERAADEERRRIARELHDSISQALFSMSLQVRTASVALEREDVDPRSPLARAIGELARLTRGALAEIRALIFELRPEGLREEGLVAALRKHAAAVGARDGVPLDVDLPDEPLPLDPGVEEELYRVAQEAIHNAVRHADATRITLGAGLHPEQGIWLEIADDGRGFDPGLDRPGHLGLRGMAERAARAGGDLSIDSAPGAGTRVRVSLPFVAAGAGR